MRKKKSFNSYTAKYGRRSLSSANGHKIQFDLSKTKAEAIAKRNALAQEHGWRDSWHLQKCVDSLTSPKFDFMITCLEDPRVPRS